MPEIDDREQEHDSAAASMPTYGESLFAYLREGYSAYQGRRQASLTLVRKSLRFSRDEWVQFEKHLVDRSLINLGGHDERRAGTYQLLPEGRLAMEQWPAVERSLERYGQAIEEAPAPAEAKSQAKGWLREYIFRKLLDKGVDYVWENRQSVWSALRLQFPWLPELPF